MNRVQLVLPLVHLGFFALLALGWYWGELTGRWIRTTAGLWLGAIGILWLLGSGSFGAPETDTRWFLFSGIVALLDIVLVLKVFKGDINIKT